MKRYIVLGWNEYNGCGLYDIIGSCDELPNISRLKEFDIYEALDTKTGLKYDYQPNTEGYSKWESDGCVNLIISDKAGDLL